MPRRRTGERLKTGTGYHVLDDADVTSLDALADTLLHRAPLRSGESFSITTQGFDYPSLARCPALADDGLCSIHMHGKPSMCAAVPLDPMVPDSMQHFVLAERNSSSVYLGANCIREGQAAEVGSPLHSITLVANGRIQDPPSQEAVQQRRTLLALDREFWADAVFESLRRELFESAAALARIPADGLLTISLVPALLAIASYSDACRLECIAYIDSQLALIERNVGLALQRRRQDDRPITRELRAFADAYSCAKNVLAQPPRPNGNPAPEAVRRVQSWLGC